MSNFSFSANLTGSRDFFKLGSAATDNIVFQESPVALARCITDLGSFVFLKFHKADTISVAAVSENPGPSFPIPNHGFVEVSLSVKVLIFESILSTSVSPVGTKLNRFVKPAEAIHPSAILPINC